jgi:hypothetical protein
MDLKNFIVAVFIIVIVLSIISILPTPSMTGNFVWPSMIKLDVALMIIAFALFSIKVYNSKKNYYPS